MSAFNTLSAAALCPRCGNVVSLDIQFRYGAVWQYVYTLGETLRWGKNDVGTPGRTRVRVEGIAGPCPKCDNEFQSYAIIIVNDIVTAVEPVLSPRADTLNEGFVVEEP